MKTLIGVDGSDGSNFAVALAGRLISSESDRVVLYYSPPTLAVRDAARQDATLLEEARHALAERVFARTSCYLPESIASDTQRVIGEGKARDGILAAAKEHSVDLIAVGARGTNRFAKMLLGSVSRAVVHASDIPTLVARGDTDAPARPLKVLLACERDGISDSALALVNQLNWPPDSVGYAVHVIESVFAGNVPEWLKEEALQDNTEPLSRMWVEEEAINRQQADENLTALCNALPPLFHGRPPVILEGHAGGKLLEAVGTYEIDLVIMGAHHLGPIARFLGGSTSEQVLGHAPCSILIVPRSEQS